MKQFFKMVAASLLALVLAGGALVFFSLVIIGGLAAMAGEAKPRVPDGSVLVFDVSATISDAPDEDSAQALLAGALGTGGPRRLQTRRVVDAMDRAAKDPRIKGLLLHGSFEASGLGSGFGALFEVRTALERFRAAGKPVIAYLVQPSTRDYLVASVADRVVLHPMGTLATPGLNAEVIYWGGLFERYGVGVQVARAGAYKSGGESFTKESMSDNEREQLTELLDDVWAEFIAAVTRSRRLDEGALQRVIDETGLIGAEMAETAGLVDELSDFSSLLDELKTMTGEEAAEASFKQIALPAYIALDAPAPGAKPSGPQIAVVYAEGEIIDGEGLPGVVGGDQLARDLRALRHDDAVKSVVLRVNSPGGSAVASEVIRLELARLQAVKPVVVSMGSYAASGGYWIATASSRIFAEPSTITGSIGVFAVLPNVKGLADRFAVKVESVKTGRHADVFSLFKPRDEDTMRMLQASVDDTYEKFLDRVVESRKLPRDEVDAMAQGRVWSGSDALRLGLVDEIGGLDRAIAHAAAEVTLSSYTVVDYPPVGNFLEQFMQRFGGPSIPLAARTRASRPQEVWEQARSAMEMFHDSTGVYARMPVFLRIH